MHPIPAIVRLRCHHARELERCESEKGEQLNLVVASPKLAGELVRDDPPEAGAGQEVRTRGACAEERCGVCRGDPFDA